MKNLVILVADKNMEQAILGIIEKLSKNYINDITFDIFVHPERDSGIFKRSHELLRPLQQKYERALVFLDHEGSGANTKASKISDDIQQNLNSAGWNSRSKVIVISPELDIWVWTSSANLASCLGWNTKELRHHLKTIYHCDLSIGEKPARPKEVLEEVLRRRNIPRSSSLYRKIALSVSLKHCSDSSFNELKGAFKGWFPKESECRI